MWKLAILVLAAIAIAEACQYKKNECPDYTVVEQHADYEVRSYNEITWVSTSEESSSMRTDQYTAFMRLFRYISGKNDKEQKMAMTVPVRMQTTATKNGTLLTMDFMVPAEFAAEPPVPTDPQVKIVKEKPSFYAVRSFGGYIWRRSRWTLEAQKLADSLKNDKTVDLTNYFQVGYDAPFDFWNRRNEIWMSKKPNQESNAI